MPEPRRKFDREFKINLMNQIMSGEKSITELAAELNLNKSMISRWKGEFCSDPEHAFPGVGRPINQEVVRSLSLQEQLNKVTAERDILMMAIALIFKREFKSEDIESIISEC